MRPPTPHNTEEEVESEEMEMEEVHSEVLEEEYEEVENEDENGEKNEEENEEIDEVEQTLSSDPSQADVVEQTLSSDPPQADVVEQTLSSDPPQATSVRMRRRERGAYGIDGRGRTVTMISASQSTCSLQHLPIKTSSHTLRYAAGKDEAAYSALAAQLLQFPEALGDGTSAITHLPHMVSRLVDTSTTFLSPHPCPAPASPAPADLAAWDCSGQVIHIRRLLQLAGRNHYHGPVPCGWVPAAGCRHCQHHHLQRPITCAECTCEHCQQGQRPAIHRHPVRLRMRGVCRCSLWVGPGRREDAMQGIPGGGQILEG